MEIRKTAISSLPVGPLIRQRETVPAVARPDNEIRDRAKTVGGSPQEAQFLSPEELRAALHALEQRSRQTAGEATASAATVDGRARKALNAYLTQQNLPQDDNNSALSAMLGVDYFA